MVLKGSSASNYIDFPQQMASPTPPAPSIQALLVDFSGVPPPSRPMENMMSLATVTAKPAISTPQKGQWLNSSPVATQQHRRIADFDHL